MAESKQAITDLDTNIYLRIYGIRAFTPLDYLIISLTTTPSIMFIKCLFPVGRVLLVQEGEAGSCAGPGCAAPHVTHPRNYQYRSLGIPWLLSSGVSDLHGISPHPESSSQDLCLSWPPSSF